ncbi:carboxylesterase [Dendrothele bispora CBS 962.96]|uniref:Carboxylic ester hydrolase n=1 Tax=Dendrothele bispora (strain CBS 962.96) TaxID=1314807 RepID=A0A4S8M106_DENBC|nr:carboxylesterase [Dendrothele bispora CBS 962.96]
MGNVLAPYKRETCTLDLGDLGSIKGLLLSRAETNEPLVKRFLNVPYMLPPTGAYRWRRPRPLPTSFTYNSSDGTPRDCTEFGPLFPQPRYTQVGVHSEKQYSEDSLTLNIWTPPGEPPAEGWPVMLWFHGGWLQVGDPSIDPDMDPTELISKSGGNLQCVFIAAAYRLSVFGFMASHELAEEAKATGEMAVGNYGLWDQYTALEWVYDNVHYFGGNKDEIILSGRSAGAYSTHAIAAHDLLMNKEKECKYKRLVMYSNAIPANPKTISEVQPQFEELLNACSIPLSLSGPEKLAALRSIPALDLIDKIMTLVSHTFRPIRDGVFFPHDMFERFHRGEFAAEFKRRGMKVLIGETRDEETLYRQTNPPTDLDSLYEQVGNYYSPAVTKVVIDAYYNRKIKDRSAHPDPDQFIDPWKKVYGDIISDGQVRAPTRLLVRQLASAGVPLSSVHRYLINFRPSFLDVRAPSTFGVSHAFDKPIWNFSVFHGPTPEEEKSMRLWIDGLRRYIWDEEMEWGTKAWDEVRMIGPRGEIEVVKDEKWDYLIVVGDEMSRVE